MTHHGMPTGTQLAQIKNIINMYDVTFYQTEGNQKMGQKNPLFEEEDVTLMIKECNMLHEEQRKISSDVPQVDGTVDLSEDDLSEEENKSIKSDLSLHNQIFYETESLNRLNPASEEKEDIKETCIPDTKYFSNMDEHYKIPQLDGNEDMTSEEEDPPRTRKRTERSAFFNDYV